MMQALSRNEANPNKRRRLSTRGSSMDLLLRSSDLLVPLKSEDAFLSGGLEALTSADFAMRLESADIARDVLNLPDSAVTAAAAAATDAAEPLAECHEDEPSKSKEEKIGRLRAKKLRLERSSTGDELVPLNMSFRISSGEWVKDFEAESGELIEMHPSLFLGNHPSLHEGVDREPSASPLPFKPIRPLGGKPRRSSKKVRISSSEWIRDFGSPDSGPMLPSIFVAAEQYSASPPPLSVPLASHYALVSPQPQKATVTAPKKRAKTTATSASEKAKTKTSSAASKGKRKPKKDRTRILDESTIVEPTEGDVLSGRGGYTNSHPGNIRFRAKALELRAWYEESSKEEKQRIADILVDFVKNEGNRFLGKGKDGLWHEMVEKGPHYKASQALRERLR